MTKLVQQLNGGLKAFVCCSESCAKVELAVIVLFVLVLVIVFDVSLYISLE